MYVTTFCGSVYNIGQSLIIKKCGLSAILFGKKQNEKKKKRKEVDLPHFIQLCDLRFVFIFHWPSSHTKSKTHFYPNDTFPKRIVFGLHQGIKCWKVPLEQWKPLEQSARHHLIAQLHTQSKWETEREERKKKNVPSEMWWKRWN